MASSQRDKLKLSADCPPLWLFPDTRKEGPSLLLVLKWGGELTPAGRVQAEELGRAFRCMYPGGQGETHTSMFTTRSAAGIVTLSNKLVMEK